MSWTFRAAGTTSNGNNASSLTPGLPSGWSAGDLHILVFSCFGGTGSRAPSPPSGWSTIPASTDYWANGTAKMAVYYRVAVAGDGNPTVSLTGTGASGDTQLSRIYGFTPTSDRTPTLSVIGATSTNSSADNVGPITGITGNSGELICIVGGKTNDWNGTGTLTGWTSGGQNESTTGNDAGNTLLYQLSWGGGSTGDLTITDNGSTASNGLGLGILFTFHDKIAATTGSISGSGSADSAPAGAVWNVGGSSSGVAAGSGEGAAIGTTVGSAVGVATLAGEAGAVWPSAGSVSAISSALADGVHVLVTIGSIAGSSQVAGEGEDANPGNIQSADGTALGTSEMLGSGVAIWAIAGTTSGQAAISGISGAIASVVGDLQGVSAANGVMSAFVAADGAGSGSSTSAGLAAYIIGTIGTSTVGGTSPLIIND